MSAADTGSGDASSCFSKWVEGEQALDASRELTSATASGPRGGQELENELLRWPLSRNKVKDIVRQGVSASRRKQLWLVASGAARSAKAIRVSRYEETLRESFGDSLREDLACPAPFLPPTGCHWWLLSRAGQAAGCRILVAIERNHPEIAFCPELQPLAAILLHVHDEEADCYEILCGLVEADNAGDLSFLDQSHAAVSSSQLSFGQVARKKAKSSYRWLQAGLTRQVEGLPAPRPANDEEMMQSLGDWMNWMRHWLPVAAMIRLLDCYFVEGKKVLYRAALGMMKLAYRATGHRASGSLEDIKENTKSLRQAALLQCAFKVRNLSWRLVQQCRQAGQTLLAASPHITLATQSTPPKSPSSQASKAVPGGQVESVIVKDGKLWSTVLGWLPARHQIKKLRRIFCTEIDGYNLATLYERCDADEPLVLLVKSSSEEVFGAFLSVSLRNRLSGHHSFSYFGSGETLLFSLMPTAACHRWAGLGAGTDADAESGATDYFIAGDTKALAVGGGGSGFGIWLDSALDNGSSTKCTTFNNPPLVASTDGAFRVVAVEMFSLDDE